MLQKIKNNPFVLNSVILFGGTMLANILNYIFHLAVGRMVSVEIYGEIESLVSLINIISVPAMTLTFIATRYASHSKANQNPQESYLLFQYLNKKVFKFGTPLFILALLFTPFIARFMNIDSLLPFYFIWIMMFFSFFSAVVTGLINGWQKFKRASLIGIIGTASKLFFAIILIKIGFALNGAIGSFLLGALASYIAALLSLKFIFKFKNDSKESQETIINFSSIKKYALPTFFGALAINILGNVDMILAKHNLDDLSAGHYGALTIVSKIIFFATGVIATVLFSMASEESHKKINSQKTFRLATFVIFLVSGTATLIYYLFPKLVLFLLFGNKYFAVSHFLVWFAILVSLYSFVNLITQYLLSIQKTKPMYGLLAISLIMALALLFLGKNIYDILKIGILFQILAIIWGMFFVIKKDQEKNV